MDKNFRKYPILVPIVILVFSFLTGIVSAAETTHSLSVIMRKEAEFGEGIKFDMFLHSSVTFNMLNKIKPGENMTGTFGFNQATIMFFLGIPSINRTYVTEAEIPLEDSKPITPFDGVTLVIDLIPSANLLITGPATLNQTNIVWENFLEKQSFVSTVYSNASSTETIKINSEFYLNAKISVNIQLQNYTTEITSYPIPQMEMLPKISNVIEIESSSTTFEKPGNPTSLILVVVAITLTVITLLGIRKYKTKKGEKEIPDITTKKPQDIERDKQSRKSGSNIFCIYCGEQLPAEATYCRKCGKKLE